jgi:hypothetical protein
MELFLEVMLQFIFELLLQLLGEFCCELGLRSLAEVFERRQVRNPWLASVGYFLLGAAVGGISLLIVSSTVIHNSVLRVLNLFLTPILAGLVMAAIGLLRRRKGQYLVRLDRFGYGFVFAFGMALVRFSFAAKPSA